MLALRREAEQVRPGVRLDAAHRMSDDHKSE